MSIVGLSAALGGRCELLVCEIVDDMLLGESVPTTVADARRRLLTKDAIILPQYGAGRWRWSCCRRRRQQRRRPIGGVLVLVQQVTAYKLAHFQY